MYSGILCNICIGKEHRAKVFSVVFVVVIFFFFLWTSALHAGNLTLSNNNPYIGKPVCLLKNFLLAELKNKTLSPYAPLPLKF